MTKNCGVYIILSPSNRCYIGSSKNIRSRKSRHFRMLEQGIHHCSGLQRAWVKYSGKLTFHIVEECSEETRIEREQWWIDNHSVGYGRMYNASSIAGRPEHTPEVLKKISDRAKGRVVSEETRKLLSTRGTGKRHTQETINKIKAHGYIGQKMTDEHINKMKIAKALKGCSDETRAKMSKNAKARKVTCETRAAMGEAQRARFQRDGGLSEATKEKLRQPRGQYRPRSEEGVRSFLLGNPKRSENTKAQRLREHMARLNWITGSNF